MSSRSGNLLLSLKRLKPPAVSTRFKRFGVYLSPRSQLILTMMIGVQAGGIYVNQETMWRLRTMFDGVGIPRLVMEEWLRNADEDFENNVKPDFPRPGGRYSITLDRASYQDRALGIRNGRLQLPQ